MTEPTPVPASIEAAWGLRTRPGRGPKPGLSLGRIVEAAIAVADAEGLAAVSMNRVATELGSSAMSLYRYVGAKDELLALMVDQAFGPPPEPVPGEDWRAALERWAYTAFDGYMKRPWVGQVPLAGPPITPVQITWLEAGLRALAGTGLTEAEKVSTTVLMSTITRNWARLVNDIVDAARSGEGIAVAAADYAGTLTRLADPARFPAVHVALAAGAFDDEDGADDGAGYEALAQDLRFAVDRVLDGLEVLIRRRVSAAADDASTDPAPAARR